MIRGDKFNTSMAGFLGRSSVALPDESSSLVDVDHGRGHSVHPLGNIADVAIALDSLGVESLSFQAHDQGRVRGATPLASETPWSVATVVQFLDMRCGHWDPLGWCLDLRR